MWHAELKTRLNVRRLLIGRATVATLVLMLSGTALGQTGADVSDVEVESPDSAFPAGASPSFSAAELTAPATDFEAALAAPASDDIRHRSGDSENPLTTMLSPEQLTPSLQTVLLVGLLSLAPAVLVMSTCFARIAIVLGLLRQGLGAQQWLPNQIMLALSLFLTLFVMAPVWRQSYEDGIKPYVDGKYESTAEQRDAFEAAAGRAAEPVRQFMSRQIAATGNEAAIDMLLSYQQASSSEPELPQYYEDVPLSVLLPAYLLSELKTAFVIGIQIVLPFLVIDLVVASILTGMGLMMLPPVLVSLPFKLLLFVLIDGWTLTVEILLRSLPMT